VVSFCQYTIHTYFVLGSSMRNSLGLVGFCPFVAFLFCWVPCCCLHSTSVSGLFSLGSLNDTFYILVALVFVVFGCYWFVLLVFWSELLCRGSGFLLLLGVVN